MLKHGNCFSVPVEANTRLSRWKKYALIGLVCARSSRDTSLFSIEMLMVEMETFLLGCNGKMVDILVTNKGLLLQRTISNWKKKVNIVASSVYIYVKTLVLANRRLVDFSLFHLSTYSFPHLPILV